MYLEYSGASFATHQAGKQLVCQTVQPLADKIRQDQDIRMHSVRAIGLPEPYCQPAYQFQFIGHTYTSWSAKYFASFIYSARCSAIWRRKEEALSREVFELGKKKL